jgi:hypothetical protein
MPKEIQAGGGEDDVVDVEEQVGNLSTSSKNEQGGVREGCHKPYPMHIVGEALVPHTRSLLESIEGLVESTDMLRPRRVDEARWLLTIDHLIKIAMEKGVLDVELMNRPRT